ncbi:MAG: ATP-binding cassette domain-containing protein [Clostridia bacterium]|nr:ATP-binding cassette domain-containing protein [Clostridia bacterium]
MSLFRKQLQTFAALVRKKVAHNLRGLGDTIMGRTDRLYEAETARQETIRQIRLILQYLSLEAPKNPPEYENIVEQMEAVAQPSGAMKRRVALTEGWWKEGDGPLLAAVKGEGRVLALLPGRFGGYYYTDPKTGERVKINETNRNLFEDTAYCFYKPLPQEEITDRDYIRFLLRQFRCGDLILLVIAGLGVALVGVLTPLVTKIAFASVIPTGQVTMLLSLALMLGATAIGGWLMRAVKTALTERIRNRLNTVAQNAVFSRLMNLPMTFFDARSTGGLAQQASCLNMLPSILCDILLSAVLTTALGLVNVYPIFSASPALVMPTLTVLAASVALFVFTVAQERERLRGMLSGAVRNNGVVYDFISGIQKIRLAGSEDMAFAKWLEAYRDKAGAAFAVRFPSSARQPLLTFIRLLGTLWTFIVAYRSGLSVAQFAVFASAYGLLMSCVDTLAMHDSSFAYLRPVLEMGRPILREAPEQITGKRTAASLSGRIELNNVTFRYTEDGPIILNDLSLSIQPGEYVAVVGKTGCGKSTLIKLLLGFLTPQQGIITYDGVDLRRIDKRSLRRNIGVVLQDGKLFTGDIFSNITISAPWLTMDDAWEAAEKAGIADFIRELPMGMHTFISEGAAGLSGGQRQRLIIARAICTKANILMFDEATSALDNMTQKIVTDSLNAMGCTRIVIAHRLSTIRSCDRIVALDGGRIVESGSYDELMAQKGFFEELVARQQISAL